MCQLFETIRVENGAAQHLCYHQQRVDRSVGGGKIWLENYVNVLELPPDGCFKLRIVYSEQGIVQHTITPYVARSIATLRLVVDNEIVYDRKSEDRSVIERLTDLRNGCDDIIIVRRGLITDSSFANLAFFDGMRWVTPREPLLKGTCRARLLDSGELVEECISVASLQNYSKLQLINAMLDFDPRNKKVEMYFDQSALICIR